jgi:hypothetical protein
MANHAYVASVRPLYLSDVDANVRKIVKEKLTDQFEVDLVEAEKTWYIKAKVPTMAEYLSFYFWLDTSSNFPARPYVIEFRHGHTFQFMWWVEAVIRENLGQIYEANMYDDGCEISPIPNPEKYESFEKFTSPKGYGELFKQGVETLRKEGLGNFLDALGIK